MHSSWHRRALLGKIETITNDMSYFSYEHCCYRLILTLYTNFKSWQTFGHARNLLLRLQQIANAMNDDDDYFKLTEEDKKIKFYGRKKAVSIKLIDTCTVCNVSWFNCNWFEMISLRWCAFYTNEKHFTFSVTW